ncbi:adenylate kinase [Heterostelium album PN500]|uniref:Adenylate kinase n=1 Tax=Heterostelium pallidum (strain ATCC 26659 / Pp 5 / PN500) TaxID=670386 RepID=D3BC66_HETP5|nr:adenylate kinase [Heterostelium album PN500]EFA81249.1 adenylate kinase [Heterostelium album PN500]|eukprot:XP_020433367.1 adenylate kinase [Heterostelium album PN500]
MKSLFLATSREFYLHSFRINSIKSIASSSLHYCTSSSSSTTTATASTHLHQKQHQQQQQQQHQKKNNSHNTNNLIDLQNNSNHNNNNENNNNNQNDHLDKNGNNNNNSNNNNNNNNTDPIHNFSTTNIINNLSSISSSVHGKQQQTIDSMPSPPKARRIKATGGMVNDSFVFHTILEELRKVEYRSGVVVDGFPRTNIQVECINALYEKMKELRKSYFNTPQASCFPRPVFRVTVLFVEEKESVDRQIRRGQITKETNIKLRAQGLPLLEERDTDTSEDAARKRYKIFKDHYSTLQTLKKHFPFSIIDASKAIGEVQQSIIKEFKYQSSLELAEETYDMVQRIPLVSDITDHARVDLVTRLDEYQFRHTDLFASVINIIDKDFIPTVRRHSIAGSATMRVTNRIFSNPLAVDMALDVLSERGFRATVDVRTTHIPHRINPTTMEIETTTQHEYMFKVDFQAPLIRLENLSTLHPKMGKA